MMAYVVPHAVICPGCGRHLQDVTLYEREGIRAFICVDHRCLMTNRRFQLRLTTVELIEEEERSR